MKYNFVVAGKWQFSFGAWHCMSLLDTKQLSLDRDSHSKLKTNTEECGQMLMRWIWDSGANISPWYNPYNASNAVSDAACIIVWPQRAIQFFRVEQIGVFTQLTPKVNTNKLLVNFLGLKILLKKLKEHIRIEPKSLSSFSPIVKTTSDWNFWFNPYMCGLFFICPISGQIHCGNASDYMCQTYHDTPCGICVTDNL